MGNLIAQGLSRFPQNIPLLPEKCVAPFQQTTCSFFGYGEVDCIRALDFNGIFINGILGGHLWTATCMFIIGIVGLYYSRPYGWHSSVAINASLYSIITGLFALLRRETQLGVPLLVGAALHNLNEWIFMVHLGSWVKTQTDLEKYSALTCYWIIFVVGMVIMLPSIELSTNFEQIFGILADHALVLYWGGAYLFKQKGVKDFFMIPFVAHTIHMLFTILPLVFANFTVGHTSWMYPFFNEIFIYVSAPITHSLYLYWGFKVDELRAQNKGVVPTEYRITHFRFSVGLGFIAGLISLFAAPYLLPVCTECQSTSTLVGTSVAKVYPGFGDAFMDSITRYNLVNRARQADGNIQYEVTRDVYNPDVFRFVEHWRSQKHLETWLQGYPQVVFEDPQMQGILVNNSLTDFGGYSLLDLTSNCTAVEQGALAFTVESQCPLVWKDVSNWANCNWVIGCEYAVVHQDDDRLRTLHFVDGSQAQVRLVYSHDKTYDLKYAMPAVNYTGNVKLEDIDGADGCLLTYVFTVPRTGGAMTAMEVYDNFYSTRIPGLQQLYGVGPGTPAKVSQEATCLEDTCSK